MRLLLAVEMGMKNHEVNLKIINNSNNHKKI